MIGERLGERLVGRADELEVVEQLLDELDRRSPSAIEVTGEPGIGKTRLLRELAARAEARGHLVLGGSASELERDLPFSVFVDSLDEYLRGLDPERLGALDDQARAELAHVFPSLWTLAHDREVAPQHERYRSHRAVRDLLERLAGPRPLVLVLDDIQWADSASVELLAALLRRPPASPVLTALALRPHPTRERLSSAVARAHRDGLMSRIELGPLSLADAGAFLGPAVDAARTSSLYETSGGNPFYLQQLARTLDLATATGTGTVELSQAIE
ncbi:MAG: AAA family ATPase, partial [Actinomycetota bacterium]